MLQVAVGHSCDPDSQDAIEEVIEQCLSSLAGAIPQAGILLGDIDFDYEVILQHIHQTFPGIELIGGTSDGEMSSVLGFQQDSIMLMLLSSDTVEMRAGVGRTLSQGAVQAAQQAISQAREKMKTELKLCVTLPESLTVSGADILRGLKQELGRQIPIFGGLVAPRYQCKQTYQFFQTEVLSDAVPVLLLGGDLLVSSGVTSGWQPIGEKGIATKADKNIVYEINGKPACDFYQNYLGNLSVTPEWGMAVFEEDTDNFYMRSLNSTIESSSGSLAFIGDVPEGATVQLTAANRDEILSASKVSMQQALAAYPGTEPTAALFFSCAGRRVFLGPEVPKEYEIVSTCLPAPLPNLGFYTYGELGSFDVPGESYFHNQTFVTLLLGTR